MSAGLGEKVPPPLGPTAEPGFRESHSSLAVNATLWLQPLTVCEEIGTVTSPTWRVAAGDARDNYET